MKGIVIMAAINSWTPMGCGATAMGGLPGKETRGAPVFPCDLVARVEHLDLGIEDVFLAWEISRLAGEGTSPELYRALVLLILAARVLSGEGSTRLPLARDGHLDRTLDEFKATDSERKAISTLLVEAQEIGRGDSSSSLSNIFGGAESYRPLIIDQSCLYLQKLHVLEARVGAALNKLISSSIEEEPDPVIESALDEVFSSPPGGAAGRLELDSEQKAAVRAALNGRIAIVSGRPGSGKTSIVASVLRVLARTGNPPLESIALAAPTGKAADRMRRSIANHLSAITDAGAADQKLVEECPPSSTLHRLLGYMPGLERFRHNENNPLSEQLIIIDESSMIDLAIMDHLLRALQPEARVVFLGDADQLPSIETGAVLRDLCRSRLANKQGRVAVLKMSYRAREEDISGKRILDAAAAINEGASPAEAGGGRAVVKRMQAQEILFEGIEHLEPGTEAQRVKYFAKWHERLRSSLPDLEERLSRAYEAGPSGFDQQTTVALREIFNHYERFKILCVTRITAGGTGSEFVNTWFHHRWIESRGKEGTAAGSSNFQVGEPVMITRNDYSLRLYNGDSGLVLVVSPEAGTRHCRAESMAVFPRGGSFVAFPLEALRGRLERAWATTVHKAQGSEHENVTILLPEVHVRPLTRELLYTAVTRAKKSVVIIGSGEVLESAVKRTMERASGLADILG